MNNFNKFFVAIVIVLTGILLSSCQSTQKLPHTMKKGEPKIALVLGGGSAKGFAHIGVIRVLEQEKIPIHMIVGTSVGSLIGGIYAANPDSFQLEWLAFKIDKNDILDLSIIYSKLGPAQGARLESFVEQTVAIKKIEDTKIPFFPIATDFEQGTEGWQDASSGLYHWSMSTVRSHSPQMAWLSSVPSTTSDQRLVSPVFSLPTGKGPLSLSFWHRWTFDSNSLCNDGGLLELSTDNGSTWTSVPASMLLTNPYTGVIRSGVFNPLASRQAWCGVADWSWTVVDLAAYAGKNVTFRFRMGSGNAGAAEGWYVDDVRVQSCIQPAPQQLFLPLLMK